MKELAEEKTPRELKGVVESIFGEMTVMGFVSLVMYVLTSLHIISEADERCDVHNATSGGARRLSDGGEELCGTLFGWKTGVEGLVHMVHTIHFILFLTMCLYLVEIFVLIYSTSRELARWRTWETALHGARLAKCAGSLNIEERSHRSAVTVKTHSALASKHDRRRRRYELFRLRFIAQNSRIVGAEFDFAGYLARRAAMRARFCLPWIALSM